MAGNPQEPSRWALLFCFEVHAAPQDFRMLQGHKSQIEDRSVSPMLLRFNASTVWDIMMSDDANHPTAWSITPRIKMRFSSMVSGEAVWMRY
jgi:hypothetical protein